MQHIYSRWIWPLLILPSIITGKWELFLIVVGFVITSQSLHESIHHPTFFFARARYRLLGAVLVLLGAYLLR